MLYMSTLCWFQGHQLHLVFMSFQPLFNLEELLRFSVCFLNMIILKSLDQVCLFVCFVFLQNDLTQMLSSLLIICFGLRTFVKISASQFVSFSSKSITSGGTRCPFSHLVKMLSFWSFGSGGVHQVPPQYNCSYSFAVRNNCGDFHIVVQW